MKKKGIVVLLLYMMIFLLLFAIGLYGIVNDKRMFQTEIPLSNMLILIVSFIGVGKTFWHILMY